MINVKKLNAEEEVKRNLYLRLLAKGEIQGPLTGLPSIDRIFLKYYPKEAILKQKPNCTIYEMIYNNNKDHLDDYAIQYFNKYITYKELFDNIEKAARALKAIGVKEGDIINVSLPNIPEAVYLFYAVSKIGAIANMFDPRASANEIKHYLDEVKSNYLFIVDDPTVISKVNSVIAETTISKIVKISPMNSLDETLKPKQSLTVTGIEVGNYNSFIKEGNYYFNSIKTESLPERYVVIEHTGGTTGIPKGVPTTNYAINMIAHHFLVSDLKFKRNQRWLNIMPTFIAYGIGNGLHLPLVAGMCVIAIPKFEPDKMDELVAMYKPDNFAGVPIHYESIIKSQLLKDADFSNWILPGVGGDSMDIELEKEANKFLRAHGSNTDVIKGYGLTEVCAAACVTFNDANALGSVGIPFVHNDISVFDPDTGKELTYGEIGEICISSPSLMTGYYQNEQETNNVIKIHSDGKKWLHTGDIGYITKDGLIYIEGRSKRVIIRYDGFKIYPFDAEKLITSLPEVEACKAIATPDVEHIQGYLPQANIILKDEYKGRELEVLEKIKNACINGLADYKVPIDYQFIDEFPRTAIGKIDYVAMENKNKEKVKRKVR